MYALRTSLCDFYFSRNGADYDVTAAVDSATFEDPERKHLTRGSSGQNKTGLIYTEGIKDPKTLTVAFIGLSQEMAAMLADMYKEEERTDFKSWTAKPVSGVLLSRPLSASAPCKAPLRTGPKNKPCRLFLKVTR